MHGFKNAENNGKGCVIMEHAGQPFIIPHAIDGKGKMKTNTIMQLLQLGTGVNHAKQSNNSNKTYT